jgi:hypothetical protein
MAAAKYFYPTRVRSPKKLIGVKHKRYLSVRAHIFEFFQKDDVSTLAPGKKDCIMRKKTKKQKRYLNNSLQYLYQKFCEESDFIVCYCLFCQCRPFWVVQKNVNERDTCLCQKHDNAEMMVKQMKAVNIVTEGDAETLVQKGLCCERWTEACFLRECALCANKMLEFKISDKKEKTYYDRWETKMEKVDGGRDYKRIVKKRIVCTKFELVQEFFSSVLFPFSKHVGIQRHQYRTIAELKSNLLEYEAVIHVDFAENTRMF